MAVTFAPSAAVDDTRASSGVTALPWPLAATVFAATSIIVGVIWDISWHRTIGRDTFWTPAHLAIYLGGILGGLSAGFVVLKTTFAGTQAERDSSVRIWGFRGPLGAWVSIWGAIAMVASAPFDDWWHNAYGLDVKILSLPHTVLALGIAGIVTGALLQLLPLQNRTGGEGAAWAFAYVAGFMLSMIAVMQMEFLAPVRGHTPTYYRAVCVGLPGLLAAFNRAGRLRWPATMAAASYMFTTLMMTWILPLFPAEPKLGPILTHVTHMVPPYWPVLLVVPAMAMDWYARREGGKGDWRLAIGLGALYFVVVLAVQWLFTQFTVTSPAAENWFFVGRTMDYSTGTASYTYRRLMIPSAQRALTIGLLEAMAIAMVSVRIGLGFGNWMRRVRR